ncbi:tail fiber protein [Campylobacter sp. RM9344]|uniref:Tail fiber protein n=1 Tax=Campylobacter californiensis TaxID=1032243 RepID=A0AAW3ZU20_9BACT|nr:MULTISPECIES: tail fiber protein [unclassified Campylobacter]MBE2985448.1 tail fiber protein [Campylobacter sp. RM6883]MBE2994558.1 tail fiber protein [Campylobacter sp. RM6913]MBE3029698.1 tail fiber protein [Campylobacter sp. RM9344]MBE3607183.1 tail fiber protein [Campylobacter sp. RM9337]QCD50370.1 putative phage tail collar protein [Campylobacter sp. RM6914]
MERSVMANLKETNTWEEGIYQLETTDPVVGGADGISNKQAKQLANRTSYLKEQIENSSNDINAQLAKKRNINDSYSKTQIDELINVKLGENETAADSQKLGGVAADKYALKSEISDGLKIGSYLLWSSESHTPSGFLVCDGRSLVKSEYAELFAVIGYTYGGSEENFNIPNFSDGKFFRSVGGNAAPIGEAQQDAIRNITGTSGGVRNDGSTNPIIGAFAVDGSAGNFTGGPGQLSNVNFDASRVVPTANENRPYNISVVVLIKTKDVKEPNANQIDDSIYATETKAGITKLKNSITGNAEDVAVTEKAVSDVLRAIPTPLGINQTWQDMTSQRKRGITYTNTTGRSIYVSIRTSALTGSCGGYLTVDGKMIQYFATSSSEVITLCGIIPPGSTYSATVNTGTIPLWLELR